MNSDSSAYGYQIYMINSGLETNFILHIPYTNKVQATIPSGSMIHRGKLYIIFSY